MIINLVIHLGNHLNHLKVIPLSEGKEFHHRRHYPK